MRQRFKAARGNQSGFTLIELLIVVVILGVLSGIVVFAVSNFNGDGVAAACKSDVKTVEVASEAFYAKTGGWAANVGALKTANYIKEVPPTDPAAVPTPKYVISYTAGSGTTESVVTGDITGGTVTTDCSA